MRNRYFKLIALVVFFCILTGCQKYSTNLIEDYGEFRSDKYVINLYLDVFPKQISDSTCNDYFFRYQSGVLDDRCQIFLDCTYNEAEYAKEVSRIQDIDNGEFMLYHDSNTTFNNQIIFNEDWFNYPAYVVSYEEGRKYEYAMLFENERRIVYVGLQYCPLSTIEFDYDYLPINYASFSHR